MANAVFSLAAAAGALTVTILSAVNGAWAVTVVFGLLAAGFLMRATERYWKGTR
jgi:hypothetical protein